MNLEMQGKYLSIIEDDFKGIKNMLDHIQEKIIQYPVYTPASLASIAAIQIKLDILRTLTNTD